MALSHYSISRVVWFSALDAGNWSRGQVPKQLGFYNIGTNGQKAGTVENPEEDVHTEKAMVERDCELAGEHIGMEN